MKALISESSERPPRSATRAARGAVRAPPRLFDCDGRSPSRPSMRPFEVPRTCAAGRRVLAERREARRELGVGLVPEPRRLLQRCNTLLEVRRLAELGHFRNG